MTQKPKPQRAEKIIKVRDPEGHTLIKVKAAQRGQTMGDYVVGLAKRDK